ncbi:MAG: YfiR family protein [Flavobacteriales bacterium]|jgi:hypothetical protein
MRYLFLLLSLGILTIGQRSLSAQKMDECDPRAMIQANFIYQFAANCNWPSELRKGRFTIAILGQREVFDHLSLKYGAKPIGNQTIDVLDLADLPAASLPHILFIDKSKRNELQKAVREFKNKSVLIVTNWEGALQAGSNINFKTTDGNIRYEMNTSSMDDKNIAPGVKILQWKVD